MCKILNFNESYNVYNIIQKIIDTDMEFVKNFTPPDFQVNFTPGISPNLNSFSKKKHKN